MYFVKMKMILIQTLLSMIIVLTVITHSNASTKQPIFSSNTTSRPCVKSSTGQRLCFCGSNNVTFDRQKGQRCIKGEVVRVSSSKRPLAKFTGLRLTVKPLHRSTRDDNNNIQVMGLQCKLPISKPDPEYVPLRNVSVQATIDSFAADVTLTQVFINHENTSIEAIYIFPIEENAAVYSFTAQIDNRTITAIVKEKEQAEEEYRSAITEGQTAILMRQSDETLDTFTVNVGALPPGKQCEVTIKYVSELDLVDGNAIRFVVPTTIAPRYSPTLGHLQSADKTATKYVQKTPYNIWIETHVLRGAEYQIRHVANLSHQVNVSVSRQSIDVSTRGVALDRDFILDIDLPQNRPSTRVSVEQYNNSAHTVLLAFTPRLSDFIKMSNGTEDVNTEFIFIVDCSGSMDADGRIDLAREAMLLFIRSLPVGSRFNIIRFGSNYQLLFKDETLTVIYDEQTAKVAENLSRSMSADFGGTELLEPLKHLKNNPPSVGRSRQVFLLTDGEISNTNEAIDLCRSMSSNTRIFSFGLGHSPSRSLVKGLARATNGDFVFVPPSSKVDTYVASQLGRALQPSIVNARLQWHGLSKDGSQAPKQISPLYIDDRVLVYGLFEDDQLNQPNVSVELMINEHRLSSVKLSGFTTQRGDTIRRLAAKSLIQELQHRNKGPFTNEDNSIVKQSITNLSLSNGILSPYTAFVGVETLGPRIEGPPPQTRYVPIQVSKGAEAIFSAPFMLPLYSFQSFNVMGHGSYPSLTNFAPMGPSNMTGSFPGLGGRPPPIALSMSPVGKPMIQMDSVWDTTSTTTDASLLLKDPVRWLIDQQLFNGAWILSARDVEQLTYGKSLTTFQSKVTSAKDALTTALAISILESKHSDKSILWNAIVKKGRKRLQDFGLDNKQIEILIGEIKSKL